MRGKSWVLNVFLLSSLLNEEQLISLSELAWPHFNTEKRKKKYRTEQNLLYFCQQRGEGQLVILQTFWLNVLLPLICEVWDILWQEGEIDLAYLSKGCETHFRISLQRLRSFQSKDFKASEAPLGDFMP